MDVLDVTVIRETRRALRRSDRVVELLADPTLRRYLDVIDAEWPDRLTDTERLRVALMLRSRAGKPPAATHAALRHILSKVEREQ